MSILHLSYSEGPNCIYPFIFFQVQIAKNHGCHVIGTCSSDDKVEFLKVSKKIFKKGG